MAVFLRSHFVKGHEYLSVVETFRQDGGVRQRTVLYLGRADRLDRDALRKSLERMRIHVGKRW